MGTFKDYIPLIINTIIGIILIAIGEQEVGVGILVAAATGRVITVGVNQTNTQEGN
jgi:hypothetical protein